MTAYILAIDQGTTNSRAIIFNEAGELISLHEVGLKQYFPRSGWVEQTPEDLYQNTILCCREVLKKANLQAKDIAAAGITNQRETTIIWDKTTGQSIYPAIVWQDRRTSEYCQTLVKDAINKNIFEKTGLLLDPYFSATKIVWLLDNIPNARSRAERGELLFGTVDTYLLWRLTNGKAHATDATNASRTLIFNIHTQEWDPDLLEQFNIPPQLLPVVLDNTADFGELDENILGKSIPILGMAGDQQAATIGQACFKPGMIKTTYGTGCFMLLNTGDKIVQSHQRLLSTVAYRINKQVTYGLEGSIFSAGVTIKWLRDTLKMIKTSSETETIANNTPDTGGVYLVPAFTGLGAPYWDPNARGALHGLTQNSGIDQIVRAALENVAYQTRDLLDAMIADNAAPISTMRVDGGMSSNNWLMQFLADILNIEVQRPVSIETTALGAAYLAGLQAGIYSSLDDIAKHWQMNTKFTPKMTAPQRDTLYHGWKLAVGRVLSSIH